MLRQLSRRTLAGLGFALSVVLPLSIAPSASASKLNFHLVNDTNYNVARLYMSSSNDPNWRVLRGGLGSGRSTQIEFANPYGRPCYYDFKWVFPNGYAEEVRQVNVCEYGSYWIQD